MKQLTNKEAECQNAGTNKSTPLTGESCPQVMIFTSFAALVPPSRYRALGPSGISETMKVCDFSRSRKDRQIVKKAWPGIVMNMSVAGVHEAALKGHRILNENAHDSDESNVSESSQDPFSVLQGDVSLTSCIALAF